LTEAQLTITLLEKARARIRSVIQNELERIGHPNVLDFVLILMLAACIGVLFNFSNPQGVPLVQEAVLRSASASVDAQEARRMLDEEKAVLVDARPKELYDQQHLQGAVNIPLALFDIMHMMKLGSLDPETPVIVYGRTISRLYDEELAFRLRQRDHDRVVVLSGGLDAWKAQGYPVQ
jgi:rhodanese-related sulfurtransferase